MWRILLLSLFAMGCSLNNSFPAQAQASQARVWVQVSGTVSDAGTKVPLPGVVVRARRTQQRSTSTAQGNFVLTAFPTDTLFFQAVGYRPYLLQLPGMLGVSQEFEQKTPLSRLPQQNSPCEGCYTCLKAAFEALRRL